MNKKRIFLNTLFMLIFGSIIASQFFYDKAKAKIIYNEPLVMESGIIKGIDLGLHNAASDLIWLTAIQYFGGGQSRTNESLYPYLSLATELDPHFAYPYAFGVLILPSMNQTDDGIYLAKSGIENGVEDWRIPYYMATAYYLNKKDAINAAKYFDLAANTKGAPDNIQKVAASFGSRADSREKTKAIWTGIYENTSDELVKARAEKYIIHLEILDLLEKASNDYKNKNGKNPEKIEDLVDAKILKSIPPDPFGIQFKIDPKTGELGFE